jgi:diguanylate cyclase (GGDEF)-like protein
MNTQAKEKPPMFFQRLRTIRFTSVYRALSAALKRAFDFTIALVGLMLLTPLFILVARWIKQETPGPVFYRGPRLGKDKRIFQMLKFRTMYETSSSYSGPRLTAKGDSRITPLGGWLRDTKINELPQLWNVLVGDMSLVGPRPEDPEIAKLWPEEALNSILSLRPGITSPASILYHDEEKRLSTKGSMNEYYESILPEKNRLDILYVNHHSFFSDLDTIFWTLFILVPRWAKLDLPEARFFAGPFARVGHRYFSWFLVDLVTSLAVIGGCAVLWRAQFPLNWGVKYIFLLGVILSFLFSGVNSIVGLNRIDWSHATAEDGFGLVVSSSFVTGLILLLNYFESIYFWLDLPRLPTLMIVVIGFLAGSSFIFTRYRIRLLSMIVNWWLSVRRNTLILGERVLVIGDGEASRIATWLLNRPMYRTAFSIVGLISDRDLSKSGMRVNGYWMLGGVKDIPVIIKRRDVGAIFSAAPAASPETTEFLFDLCEKNNLRLLFLSDLLTEFAQRINKPQDGKEHSSWLEERLANKAMFDVVTGLPNCYLFHDRIKQSLAVASLHDSRLAVLFIEIDRDGEDSGNLGRKFNDQILVEVANRLARYRKTGDTLAYVGKNKFALILENISDDDFPGSMAKSILESLSQPLKIDRSEVQIRTNVNIKVSQDAVSDDEFEALCLAEINNQYFLNQKIEALDRYEGSLG